MMSKSGAYLAGMREHQEYSSGSESALSWAEQGRAGGFPGALERPSPGGTALGVPPCPTTPELVARNIWRQSELLLPVHTQISPRRRDGGKARPGLRDAIDGDTSVLLPTLLILIPSQEGKERTFSPAWCHTEEVFSTEKMHTSPSPIWFSYQYF